MGRSIPLVRQEVIFRRPRRSVTSLELVPSPSRRAHQESSWVDGKKKVKENSKNEFTIMNIPSSRCVLHVSQKRH